MTTYLLHGGKTSKQNKENEYFFSQFTNLVKKGKVTILLCYFSRERVKWKALIKRDTDSIKKNTKKEVTILVAEDPIDLFKKLEKSDVLYIAGGDAELIEPLYDELKDLKIKLDGKVFAGSSMGMFFASEQYVLSLDGQDVKTIHKGLGLLPIQALCHWDAETNKQMKIDLLNENSYMPILALNEFESVVLYK
jgi:peptidase E